MFPYRFKVLLFNGKIRNCFNFNFTIPVCNGLKSSLTYSTITPITMSYNEYDLGLQDYSDSSPVVIMHGLFGSKTNWQSLAKALSKSTRKRVYTVDARNHGSSPHTEEFSYDHLAEDIRHFLIDKGVDKTCLIGHSMGGRAVMAFSLKYPEFIDKLVIVDITPGHISKSMTNMGKYFMALKGVNVESSMSSAEARKTADNQLSEKITDPAVRQFLLANLIKDSDGSFRWRMNVDVLEKKFTTVMNFPKLTNKFGDSVLFIAGTKSDYLTPDKEAEVRELFPSANFSYLDCGHWVHAEKPADFLQLVTHYLLD